MCHEFGHCDTHCSHNKRKGKKHASIVDVHGENEHLPQKKTKGSKLDEISHEHQKEYLFSSTLLGTITNNNDILLVKSGASRPMTSS